MSENLTPEQLAHRFNTTAERLEAQAERNGVILHIARATPLPPKVITGSTPRPISDREWAAQPANLREGCTVHIPGGGDM